jgi:hypothetical protein
MSRVVVALAMVAAVVGAFGIGRAAVGASTEGEAADDAGHPLVGTWLVQMPGGPSIETFSAEDHRRRFSVVLVYPDAKGADTGSKRSAGTLP